jgi:uncharacterized protein (TIGR02001 family)
MKLVRGGVLCSGLLLVAGAAQAGVTSTWTLTNDYDFRGNSQTAKDPALQGSVDYAHDSGFYAGAWGSNIDFEIPEDSIYDDPGLEVDLYGGWTKTLESGFALDFGAVLYAYPDESDFNYYEVYGSVAKGWFKAKLWYSPEFGGQVAEDTALANFGTDEVSAWYAEANATIPLPANFSITAHVGYSTGDYWDNVYLDDLIDYSVGVGYTLNKINLGLKYIDTDSDVQVTSDAFNNEERVVFTVSTTFPWAE